MRRSLALLPFTVLLLGAAPPARPQRIVSLNLCADQYLIALADRSQIAAVTRLARDPQMSAAAAQARVLPITRGGAEEVLALRPDLILAPPARLRQAIMLPGARPVAMLDLPPADDYAAIVAQVRAVASAIGHPARGEALIARMDRALARVSRDAGHGATAAHYQRRGFLTGTGTLIDDLLRRVGLRNLAARLGKPMLARVGLEELAVARPDYLIVETATDQVVDQGTEMLQHPLLRSLTRVRLPQAWTICGGPSYPLAAAALAAQLRAAPSASRR